MLKNMQCHWLRCAFATTLIFSAVTFAAAPSLALPITCLRAGSTLGAPCLSVSANDVLFSENSDSVALLMNFGIAWPGSTNGGFDLICEEAYASKTPERVLLLDDGMLFVPTLKGLKRGRIGDGCVFATASGIPDDAAVLQVVAQPNMRRFLWALTTNAQQQRALYRSFDQGLNFQLVHTFKANVVFWHLFVSAATPNTIYLSGFGLNGPFALARSNDEGATFDIQDPLPALADSVQGATLWAVSPVDSEVLYFARSTATGPEELWRSDDAGKTVKRVLILAEGEIITGFTFGKAPQDVFVSGYRLLETQGIPPAHLFKSNDGGDTWQPEIPSGAQGPRFHCLRYRNGVLWACGGDPTSGDAFLLGKSQDEGATWAPVANVNSFNPVKACVASLCPATTGWMCSTYGICSEASEPPDASVDAGAAQPREAGCSCTVGTRFPVRSTSLSGVLSLAMAFVWLHRSKRI
jgi:hypothetical protein